MLHELIELSKQYTEASIDPIPELFSKKNSTAASRISMEDTANVAMNTSNSERTIEMISPISSKKDYSCSFSWMATTYDPETMRKDLIKLTEENKYLKKRLPVNSNIAFAANQK